MKLKLISLILFEVYIIVIVVVSVHAYNLGVVKYDYKILCVVARILFMEVKKLFVAHDEKENHKKVKKHLFFQKGIISLFRHVQD